MILQIMLVLATTILYARMGFPADGLLHTGVICIVLWGIFPPGTILGQKEAREKQIAMIAEQMDITPEQYIYYDKLGNMLVVVYGGMLIALALLCRMFGTDVTETIERPLVMKDGAYGVLNNYYEDTGLVDVTAYLDDDGSVAEADLYGVILQEGEPAVLKIDMHTKKLLFVTDSEVVYTMTIPASEKEGN